MCTPGWLPEALEAVTGKMLTSCATRTHSPLSLSLSFDSSLSLSDSLFR